MSDPFLGQVIIIVSIFVLAGIISNLVLTWRQPHRELFFPSFMSGYYMAEAQEGMNKK